MTISRRGLLKALGLGGVGLVVGAGGKLFGQDVFEEEKIRLASEPVEGGLFDMLNDQRPVEATSDASEWVHPDLDKIETLLKLTGGYPSMFARFQCGYVTINSGDRLSINYTITAGDGEETELHRVYDGVTSLTVLGTSIQGPVIVDNDAPDGHRLALVEELIPNEEASVQDYIKHRDLG